MAPRRQGHVAYGKARVFHHAVAELHVGLGHAVLGSLSLQLAAGPPQRPRRARMGEEPAAEVQVTQSALTEEQAAMPAFGLELNALMQSHSAKDFKRFRWEVKEWCATPALFRLHHRLIAEKLLRCLLERNAGRYSSKSKHQSKAYADEDDGEESDDGLEEEKEEVTMDKGAHRSTTKKNSSKAKAGDATRGLASEGFEAFARLTIAFARDLQADFLPYFEVFQRALQAGLYDKQGQLLADAARVQLIYAVQAAWCREMMWYWSQKEHRVLVQRIVRLYVAQLSDRKDYLRRLTAELLGYLCRLARPLLPLVIAAATEQLLEAYALYCTAATQQEEDEEEAELDDEQSEAGDDEDNKESVHARDEHTTPTKPALSADPALWSTFVRQELGVSTLLDGLGSLCAEMLRGMRGALNSAVDVHYRLLLRSFLLCAPDYYRDDEEEDKHDEEEEDGEAQEQNTHNEAASTTMDGHKAQDVVPSAATAPTRWAYLFASPQTTPPPSRVTTELSAESVRAAPNADRQEKEEEEEEEDEERTTCVAREIVRAAGCMALSAALQQILRETRKAATSSAAGNEEESDDEEEEKKAAQGSDALDMRNPPHKVLSMVVHGLLALPDMNFSLSSSAYYYVHHHHLRLLATVLMAEDGLLLRDEATRHVMREVAKQLRRGLTSMNKLFVVAANNKEESVTCELAQVFAVQYVAALLELLMPLCLGPMLEARKHVACSALPAKERHGATGVSHALALQEVFLPVGKQCVALALQWSMTTSSERGCAQRRMMMTTTIKVMTQQCVWAFVQDVLQKSYAYALQQEEEEEGKEAMQDGVGAEERSDAASEEEEEEEGEKAVTAADQATQTTSTNVKIVTADKKKAVAKRLCSTRRGASGVRSALTPLGLTLLHRIFLVYCERASQQLLAQLRPRTASDVPEHSTHSNEGPEKEENVECAALPQDVRQTLVMLRAAAEQSPRQVCSPLQQLMRLRLARPSSSSSATQPPEEEEGGRGRGKQVSAGAALQDALEQLLLNIITELTTARTQTHNNDHNNNSSTSSDMAHALAELLACAWPLVQALLLQRLAQPGKEACVAKMQGALLALMHTVDARAHGDEAEHAARNIHKASAASEALSYTLYVQIAALLMRLSDRPVLSSKGEGSPARVSTRVQGMRYLAESIAMLARGFRSLRIASPTAQANDTEAQVEEEEDRSVQSAPREDNALQLESDEVARYLQLSVAVGGVEAGRRRLFAGAEVLLDSLAWALHHNTHCHNNGDDENNSEEGPAVAAQMTPSRRTREAIALLRQTLCAGRQDTARQLREILFECLTAAQPARVRLRALQLFSLLTHPSLGDTPHVTNEVNNNNNNNDGGGDSVCEGEEKNKIISNKSVATEKSALYLPGLTGVDPLVLHALLRAELYNPLAERTGHVDGLRQALTPLLFRCESGQMNGQSEAMRLTRAIVARAMLGLLYRKYAPAWPMAIKILAALVRTRTSKASHNEEEDKEKDEQGGDDTADVWQDVICRYAPLLVLGGQSHAVHKAARTRALTNNNKGSDDDGVQSGSEVGVCLYHIRYTLLEQRAASQEQSGGGGSSSISGMPGMALAHGNRSSTVSSPSSYSSSSLLWSVLTAAAEGNNSNNSNYNSIAHAIVPLLHWQAQSDAAYTNDHVASNSNAFMHLTGAHASHSQQPQQQMYASSSSSAAARKESERWHTDSATVACSFLAMTAEVMQGCRSGQDERIALVEQLVLALSALHRSASGGSGSGSSKIQTNTTGHQPLLVAQLGTVRRLEERLVAAMQALAQAPYSPASRTSRTLATSGSAVTKDIRRKISDDDNNKARVNGAMMQGLFLSYLTEGQQGNNSSSNNTNKLQRAALDNLKRLKVPPFATYYTQLVPYTDTVKALFGFLTTFHIDTDIPVHDRADYLAAALTIALPKLLAKGSKDKLKQQALLRRRLMSLVAQLPDDTSGLAIAEVLQKLVHRLVFASSRGISCTQANTDKKEAADNHTMVQEMAMYDFLGQWRRMVEQSWARQMNNDSHNNTTMSATHEEGNDENEKPTYYVPQHLLRRVERLAKRLTSAMELLEAVLHAIGTRFASYLPACLHLSCQAYLFACTHLLRDTVSGVPRNMIIIIHIPAHTAAALASLRRAAVTVVQMLFAQLPEQVMSVVREDIIAQCEPHVHTSHSHGEAASRGKTKKAEVEDEEDVLSASLLGRYLHALQLNTRGTQRNAQAAWQESTMNHAHHTSGGSAVQHYSKATPTLRLVTSWVRAPVLRPLLSAYSDFALETLTSLLTLSDSSTNSNGEVYWGGGALSAAALKAAAGVLYDALRDITDILDAADEPIQPLLTQQEDAASKSKSKKKASAKKSASSASVAEATGWTTLREAFVRPYITRLFAALYRLVLRGAGEGAEAHTRTTGATAKGKPTSRSSVFSFSVAMWEEIMKTVSLLAAQLSDEGHDKSTRRAKERKEACGAAPDVETMLGKLLEIVLRFVTHPVCATQSTSVTMAAAVVQRITAQLHVVDLRRHFRPMVHLFNVVTNPQARLTLCETVGEMMAKLPIALTERSDDGDDDNNGAVEEWVRVENAESTNDDAGTHARRAAAGQARTRRAQAQAETSTSRTAWNAQLQAVARAVHCLNSFAEDNTSLEAYDYELRYHTFHSLLEFFAHDGNDGQPARTASRSSSSLAGGTERDAVRQERNYSGAQDVRIPLHVAAHVPVLAMEAFALLAANVLFFLRDGQPTIRALAAQLLEAMMGYAARQPYAHVQTPMSDAKDAESDIVRYKTAVLHEVIRCEVLPSLRRGVVARDTLIRYAHLAAFNGLAKHYEKEFASFARLFARNAEQNFFSLVGHVQPRCRLHALALLRQAVPDMQIRDLLRVFIPFLLTAVKDYAQGKWVLPNNSEGRARGYCDAVLQTIATIARELPWQAYYHVLSLLLVNAREQPALRVVMLRGVVQVLHAFHILNDDDADDKDEGGDMRKREKNEQEEENKASEAKDKAEEDTASSSSSSDEEEDDEDEERKAWRAKRAQYKQHKILYVLEQDILPQLFDYVSESKQAKKALGIAHSSGSGGADVKGGNPHTAERLRSEQAKAEGAMSKHTLLQLPVAIAITKIIARFPDDRLNLYLDHLVDAVVVKLRSKQHDKQRDRARRMLAAILHEVGPSKLERVLVKLRDNLVHGYQLHVLGYTVVTLLYQLYEPHSALARHEGTRGKAGRGVSVTGSKKNKAVSKEAEEKEGEGRATRRRRLESTEAATKTKRNSKEEESSDDDDEREEAELLRQLRPDTPADQPASFDHYYGVECLTRLLPPLMQLLLDSYLGEVGMQKEQVELMSTMVEVKSNRALQGFTLLARHCAADRVLETFLHQITWLLTPPTQGTLSEDSDVSLLHGSARARALIVQTMQQKYTTLSKGAQADLPFVNKVRALAVRVARSLTVNSTLNLEHALGQIRDLLARHNAVREAKIAAFEAKDGTRRIRGNAHIVIRRVERLTRKEQMDKQLLIAPEPERVDVDFSAHTVLATQNKQKLRVYRGRYGKQVQDAAKDFYREDPTTAIVLDTLDEFLLRCLLSTLKKVLGIGRQKGSSAAAVQLDLLRQRRLRRQQQQQQQQQRETAETGEEEEEGGEEEDRNNEKEDGAHAGDEEVDDDESENEEDGLEPRALQEESDEDALDRFVTAQEADAAGQHDDEEEEHEEEEGKSTKTRAARPRRRGRAGQRSLAVQFTQAHRALLESLVPVVLLTLRGEGADAVVAEALDCLLALVALQPPLGAVQDVNAELFDVVTAYFGRGGPIKQRAMRVCAGLIAHQKFVLSTEQASQLVRLARAEMIERSEFLPMALRLLHAVLGKHVHVVEIYAIVDIVTELLVHLAAKAVVRQRCLHILVRFLTEYKLTREKFRSHIELLLRNLDFPELAGRLALLELLDQLVRRLPTVILREEAALLLVPLAAARAGAEWSEVREKAAAVLGSLVRGAGLDVLSPLLAAWLQERQPRAQRNVGLQVWSTLLPAVIGMYDLTPTPSHKTREGDESDDENDDERLKEERAALLASVSWSVESVLAGCLYEPPPPKSARKHASRTGSSNNNNNGGGEVTHKSARAQARRGWTVIFYSLRCAESMLTALPDELYPTMGPQLLPFLLQKGVLHAHPWVQAVSLRLMRHYCYNYVEPRAHFLRSTYTKVCNDDGQAVEGEGRDVLPFLGLTRWQTNTTGTCSTTAGKKAGRAFCEAGRQTFVALIGALKTVLQRVSMSDVSSEKFMALRALRDPSRTQSLKLMFYLSKAIAHVALSLLSAVTAATEEPSTRKAKMHAWLVKEYTLLHHQLHALIAPVLRQQSVVNYLVRSTTLVQFFGAYISVLPTVQDEHSEVHDEAMQAEKRWLVQAGMCVPALLRETIWPLLRLALHAGVLSRKLALLAYQSATVLQDQLAERRALLGTSKDHAQAHSAIVVAAAAKGKRKRVRDEADATSEGDGQGKDESGVEDVVREMTRVLAELQSERRTKQIRRETHKAMKRSRQEMSSARSKQVSK